MINNASQSDAEATAAAPRFVYEIWADGIPDGEIVVPVEGPRSTVIAVRQGHMSPELADKLNLIVASLIATGVWRRHQ